MRSVSESAVEPLELVEGWIQEVLLINKHADIKATGCRSNKALCSPGSCHLRD